MNSSTRVAIALGSNLGDRAAHLAFACRRLAALVSNLQVSATVETVPEGVPDRQPDFLNAAAVGATTLSARSLLNALMGIEAERGRERPHAGAARTLDLDLVLYGDSILSEDGLVVPHPRFREREFVLAPLATVAPDMRDPVSGSTVAELLARLRHRAASARRR